MMSAVLAPGFFCLNAIQQHVAPPETLHTPQLSKALEKHVRVELYTSTTLAESEVPFVV